MLTGTRVPRMQAWPWQTAGVDGDELERVQLPSPDRVVGQGEHPAQDGL
jgi:hypothetical protein